jgi:serine protease inhibitor
MPGKAVQQDELRRQSCAVARSRRHEDQEPPKAQPFHVDCPFLVAIVDDASDAVLFEGRIVDPR